ncbi:hypothetical protein [Pseudobacillus wudalianchiensis]|uniref:DUF5412 domain-containing protein n=1 Tax=Pseudobacillus wudalianchiensis TaxID=1743143 RepID=A0A1B9B938_9BACI|nr:hypothetical protein [Bacillus wudalianchiensis]OCA92599.1 hypothetical protein A8F95_02570 [Bacillus wudalianchiensis]
MKNKWFKKLKPLLITAVVLIGLYFAGNYVLNTLFGDMCGNKIVQKLPSPNGDKVAYIFQRDCGATTGTSYQLSILNSDEELPNKSGNAFVSDNQFQIKWITNDKLRVNYNKSSETYEMDKSVGWTKIEYIGN